VTINGSTGRLHLDAIRNGFEMSSDEAGKHMFARSALRHHSKLPKTWWGTLRNLVDCAPDGGEPAISGRDGLAVAAMIEAVERSIEERQPASLSSVQEMTSSAQGVGG
jgi:predicted dehydrogenase